MKAIIPFKVLLFKLRTFCHLVHCTFPNTHANTHNILQIGIRKLKIKLAKYILNSSLVLPIKSKSKKHSSNPFKIVPNTGLEHKLDTSLHPATKTQILLEWVLVGQRH